jgi:peptide/nickel transport system permease protein
VTPPTTAEAYVSRPPAGGWLHSIAGLIARKGGRSWGKTTLVAGLTILALAVVSTAIVHIFHIGSPDAPNYNATFQAPSASHLFGTDALGRDVFLRMLYATKTDLTVGLIATGIPFMIGIGVGLAAGYSSGTPGRAIMWVVDFVQAFPALLLLLVVIAVMGTGFTAIYVGFIITNTPAYIRLTRSGVLVVKEQEFVLAARTLGFSQRRVMVRHVLPHVVRAAVVYVMVDIIGTILMLAALSYLGFGVQPPTPEWGAIIAEGQTYLLSAWWITTLPGLFVMVVGLGFSLAGEASAELLRVRTSGRL